jgi:YggT family protein
VVPLKSPAAETIKIKRMQVLLFLVDTVFFVLLAVVLVRAWLNAERISMAGQPGQFIMALTDWLVMPLRRSMPRGWQSSRWDSASILAALLLALVHAGLLLALGHWMSAGLGGASGVALVGVLPLLALKLLLRTALQGLLVLVLAYAILSWVQPQAYASAWLHRLVAPLLRPFQRVIPLVGGVDLSALALVVLLQIGLMLVG